jgi:hypothetical protein
MSRIRADRIVDRVATGAPLFPNGAVVTGVATATTFDGALSGNATSATTATTATTATNAQGLTGTPNITINNLVGAAATFTGVLTYEDVTNIDSIGIITARSDVSIADKIIHTGDTNTAIRFPAADTFTVETAGTERVRVSAGGSMMLGLSSGPGTLQVAGGIRVAGSASPSDTSSPYIYRTSGVDNLNFATSGSERLRITSAGAAIFKGGLAEKYESAGTTLGSQPDNPLSDGNVILFTGNESGNKTINFTGVHATLSNGETVSFTAIITPNSSGKITAVQVDGQTPAGGLKWSGGSAPSAGSSGQDIYTFQILKTGSANTAYTVFGAAANYD